MAGAIHVTMRCFSQVRQALGVSQLELTLPAGSTGGSARALVLERAGGTLDGLPMRLAVNQRFVDDDVVLADGDELALIPPVQGG